MDLVFQNSTTDKKFKQRFFDDILKNGVGILDLNKKHVELSLNLVGEARIKELNKKYRHKDKVTDVLSFPLEDKTLQKQGIIPLGDIFICLPFAKKQAKMQNISIEEELARLTVHGFLHLLGYDHERSRREAKKMFDLEKKILNKLNS